MLILDDPKWAHYALLLIFLVIIFSSITLCRKRKYIREFGDIIQIKKISSLKTIYRELLGITAAIAVIGGLGVILGDPKWKTIIVYEEKEQLAFSIWLDNSLSMLARDVRPSDRKGDGLVSRKEMAIREIKNFADGFDGDYLNLGLFTDTAYLVLPLFPIGSSASKNILFEELGDIQEMDPNLMPQGTNIGLAVWQAIKSLEKSPFRKKIIIILSDGEQQGDVQELDSALSKSIKYFLEKEETYIYLVGVGNPRKFSLIPKKESREGGVVEYLTLPNGALIKTRPDFLLLAEVARNIRGKFIPATSGKELEGAMNNIVKERRPLHRKERTVYIDLWQYFLGAIIIIFFLMNPKRNLI